MACSSPGHGRLARAPSAPIPGAHARPPGAASRFPALGFALLAAAAVVHLRRSTADEARAPQPAESAAPAEEREPARGVSPELPAQAPVYAAPPPLVLDRGPNADAQVAADQATGDRLAARLQRRGRMTPDDLRAAEVLYTRYPAAARQLYEAVLLSAAGAEREARRFDAAAALVERAIAIAPDSAVSRGALLYVRLDQGDWPGAEAAGRALLALAPADAAGARGLATALLRQDRTREAVELLAAFLDAHPDAETRALLARIQREQAPEQRFDEAKLAHFHVRYDGDAHEEVGREILRRSSGTTRRSRAASTTSRRSRSP